MPAETRTKVNPAAQPLLPTTETRSVAIATKNALAISEPVKILAQSFGVAAALWAFLLYFSLLMFAFLWSLSEARDLYATIMDGKPINWIITAAVITGIALHIRRLQALRAIRNPAPQYSPPSSYAPEPRRKTGGVYGSANAAADYEIDAALRGKTGGFEAMFEE